MRVRVRDVPVAGSAHHHGCRCKLKRLKGGSGDYLPACERANGSEGGTRGLENPRMPPSQARVLGAGSPHGRASDMIQLYDDEDVGY